MLREYVDKKEVHLREGAAKKKDPPASSLHGGPVTLTPAKLSFDLDAGGNGWIDEADPAFAHLRLWTIGRERRQGAVACRRRSGGRSHSRARQRRSRSGVP